MTRREPAIDTVIRYLHLALDVAKKRRLRMIVRRHIHSAIFAAFDEVYRQRKKGKR